MKKVMYGVLLVAVFGLTACGNDKKETTASSKVEQLESRVKELESSSSSNEKEVEGAQADRSDDEILSELNSETNKKIVKAFLDDGLTMYNYSYSGVSEMPDVADGNPTGAPIYESGMTFYIEKGTDGVILAIENYPDEQQMTVGADYASASVDTPIVVKNNNINSIMYGLPKTDSEKELFNKYKETFENIK